MPPPAPIAAKVVIGLLMLALVTLLVTRINTGKIRKMSMFLAAAATIGLIALLERDLPTEWLSGFNDLGLLAAFSGILFGTLIIRTDGKRVPARSRSHVLWLSAFALLAGPLIGAVIAAIVVGTSSSPNVEYAYTFGVFCAVGTIASLVGCPIVALAASQQQQQDYGIQSH